MIKQATIVAALVCALAPLGAAIAQTENPAQSLTRSERAPSRNLSDPENAALYAVGYAHLDTQWRWDFVTTIDRYIEDTLTQNFDRIDNFPGYNFSFTGSVRYEMMEEYYPELTKRLRKEIDRGTWFVSGSSVDEGDVNVPSPESTIRQVLYGNLYFEREFGKSSADFMLPDCFGFPWSMPSVWAHCGLLGFSTQKLTWGSAVGIPFNVGVWEGPDGEGVIAALNPGAYVSAITSTAPNKSPAWRDRIDANGNEFGVHADYHYYGVGDVGGAPRVRDVESYTAAAKDAGGMYDLKLASSDAFYFDVTPELRENLPKYSGDMLLTEHSAGTLTSQSYMKRWNRQAERLADAAERAAVAARWLDGSTYPRKTLERAWVRLLANQMHDILPGTSIPRAYRYSWNDLVVSMNLFAGVLTDSVGRVAARMDTSAEGTPLVVFNALPFERTDLVEATVTLDPEKHPRVHGPDGAEVPSQLLSRDGSSAEILFRASVGATGFAVYDIRESDRPFRDGGLRVTNDSLENERFRVRVDETGDIASVYDKELGREYLRAPAGLVFTYERPQQYPAWNMDWADRKEPPIDRVAGPARVRVVEDGPLRVALAITRSARNSTITQTVRLAEGSDHVEVLCDIDWQSTEVALKASFPLSPSNPVATYNWGLGTIDRGNNEPKKYEVPSHEWLAMTDASGEFGVTILEDSKFGSDKPSDDELRLTLLYTPGVRGSFVDQHSQDWGRHGIRYAIAPHKGDWREGKSQRMGRRFNQPLRVFNVPESSGPLGRAFSFAEVGGEGVDARAMKGPDRNEGADSFIVRVREMHGRDSDNASIAFPSKITSVREVDGQERVIEDTDVPTIDGSTLRFDLTSYATRAFEVEIESLAKRGKGRNGGVAVDLIYNANAASENGEVHGGFAMDGDGRAFPAEQFPDRLTHHGIDFRFQKQSRRGMDAVVCRGQTIKLPGDGDTVHLIVAATEDAHATFTAGGRAHGVNVPNWSGFVGQWDDRVFEQEHGEVDFACEGRVRAINGGFIKRDEIAWFATHLHTAGGDDEAYRFSYLFHKSIPVGAGERTLTLPYDERVLVFAVSTADSASIASSPAHPLYDTLEGHGPIEIRHDYDRYGYGSPDTRGPVMPKVDGLTPTASVTIDRGRLFEHLIMGPPSGSDEGGGAGFRAIDPTGEQPVHSASGARNGLLTRLNDGLVAQNNDDINGCVWFDQGGRFVASFDGSREIERVRTYSWHRSDRSPQWFSLWGSNGEEMPDTIFEDPSASGWTFLAEVDTRPLGEGRPHGSAVSPSDGETTIGTFRHLLWIVPEKASGTFFTEIDIDLAQEGVDR